MVDASELPFRMLVRRYGAELCYTPMLHAGQMLKSPTYLDSFFTTCAGDRPLIAQFCGNDPATVLQAARLVESRVDAVDLNLGCPQGIARKGHYGSFLLEEPSLVVSIVSTLVQGLRVPVTCKIRRLPEDDKTLELVLALQAAGCSLITIHGRTRFNMKERITAADWDIIRAIKAHPGVNIPIFANGGIAHLDDVAACRAYTGADGVMSSEALLENPALFTGGIDLATGRRVSSIDLAREYLSLAQELGGADVGCAKGHLMKILFGVLSAPPLHDLRSKLAGYKATLADFGPVINEVELRCRSLTKGEASSHSEALTPASVPIDSSCDTQPPAEAAVVGYATATTALTSAALLESRERTWQVLRSCNPTLGISHPRYLHDITQPGLWYMRYRKGFSFDVPLDVQTPSKILLPLEKTLTEPTSQRVQLEAPHGGAASLQVQVEEGGECSRAVSGGEAGRSLGGTKRSRSPMAADAERDAAAPPGGPALSVQSCDSECTAVPSHASHE
jgi:tRNA-dihydrouridine synthase